MQIRSIDYQGECEIGIDDAGAWYYRDDADGCEWTGPIHDWGDLLDAIGESDAADADDSEEDDL